MCRSVCLMLWLPFSWGVRPTLDYTAMIFNAVTIFVSWQDAASNRRKRRFIVDFIRGRVQGYHSLFVFYVAGSPTPFFVSQLFFVV